jgi:hypothetical protein
MSCTGDQCRLKKIIRGEQGLDGKRRRDLRAVQQCEALLGMELEGCEARLGKSAGSGMAVTGDAHAGQRRSRPGALQGPEEENPEAKGALVRAVLFGMGASIEQVVSN